MQLKVKIFLAVFALSYFTYHLFTLSLNPLPWFDEVFFASMAKNLLEFGNLVPEVSKETFQGKEVFVYGPIHFYLESFSFRMLGFGIFQYRWIIFAFGIITILATANLLRLYTPSFKSYWLLITVFALDPFMNLCMHEGRMDLETIALMLMALYFLIKGLRENKNTNFFFSGILAVLAILITPRIGIVLLPVTLGFLFMLEGKNLKASLIKIALWSVPIILLYGWWMFFAFGGLTELFNYYKNVEETGGDYLGGRFYIPKHEYVLICLTMVSVAYGIYKKRMSYFNEAVLISIVSIVLFYIAVVDWGPYSALILPFYYFLFFYSLGELEFNFKKFSFYPLMLLFVFNLSYFGLKSLQVLAEKDIRDYTIADEFIKKNIPAGSRVIGDGQYYYSVVKAGSSHRIYDQYLLAEDRERILREAYDYDYIIITERSKEKEPFLIKHFVDNAELKKVAELKIPQSELSKKIATIGLISNAEKHGYNAEIYVRIKDQKSPVAIINVLNPTRR